MKKIVLVFFLLLNNFLIAQRITIKGKVVDDVDSPLVYFYTSILSAKDSTLETGGAFSNGNFAIKVDKAKAYLLKISSMGYSDKYVKLSVRQTNNDVDLGVIRMIKEQHLRKIVVSKKLPIIKEKNGQTIILVSSTSLSHAGSLADVLRRSPGISVDRNNNISVFGKGKVAIYVDGREIKNKDELSSILSSNIKKIVIDRFPGAKYSANIDCVIEITTKKDKTGLNIYNQSIINRTYSNIIGLDFNFSSKKWMNYLSISLSHYKSLYYVIDSSLNFRNRKNIFYTNSFEKDDIISLKPDIFYGFNYKISKNTDCQFQYSYRKDESHKISNTIENIGDNDYGIVHKILSDENDKNKSHYADIILNHNFSRSSLSFIGDYVYSYFSGINDLSETNLNHNTMIPMLVNSKSIFNVYTLKSDYQMSISKNTDFDLGSKWSLINNNTVTSLLDKQSNDYNYQLTNNLNDQILAIFSSFDTQIKKIGIRTGIRLENIHRYLMKNNIAFLDTIYWKIFPNMSIKYKFKSDVVLSLDYMKKIKRPVFWQLDPSMLYFDSLSYRVGNPELKPYIYDVVALGLSLPNSLNFSFNYYNMSNYALVVASPDKRDPNIMKYMPVNFDNAQAYSVSTDYSYAGKHYSAYIYIFGQIITTQIPFNSGYYKTNKPYWYIETDHNYDINKHLNVYLNFVYTSDMYLFASQQLPSLDFSSGFLLKFLDSRLTINIDINDILHKSISGSYDRFGDYLTYEYFDNDSRYFSIRIKYSFSKSKVQFNMERANQKEISRLK